MPNNKRHTIKQLQGKGKDKVHPGSRKAGQLDRISLRADKLSHETKMRKTATVSRMERPLFFVQQVTTPNPLTLDQLKTLIATTYLARHASQLASLLASRRPGRAKDAKLVALEDLIARERSEYASGLLLPDLTDAKTCRLIWNWLDNDVRITQAHCDLLRLVRIAEKSDVVVLAREGKKTLLSVDVQGEAGAAAEETMDVEQ